jgi:hypothetical protein
MNVDDQLNELDDILNEFGLSGEKVGENEDDDNDDEEEEEADPCDTKNDKHRLETRNGERKRLERIKGRNERDGGRYCCAPTNSQKKGKSPAEIAAATAAKEMKAKKEQAAKDAKKKKKKDKYAHGSTR